MTKAIHVQGHRGARGLRPENTFPSIEVALDVGVSSIELDLHLTAEDIPVITHEPFLREQPFRCAEPNSPYAVDPSKPTPIRQLTLEQLRTLRADVNVDPRRFPKQTTEITPLAKWFADDNGYHPYTIPTLIDLLLFVQAYSDEPGEMVGKTPEQQQRARRVRIDLELKRYPFRSHELREQFDPWKGGVLERATVEAVRSTGMSDRVIIRSFDHRSLRAIRAYDGRLTTAILLSGDVPADPVQAVKLAGASIYCQQFLYLDEFQVEELQRVGILVWPYTVNDPADWERVISWGVDGITTDFPDRLIVWLRKRGIPVE